MVGGECVKELLFGEGFWRIIGELFLELLGPEENCFVVVVVVAVADITGDFGLVLSNSVCDRGGGDSLGDRILIAASSRVNGNAGEGDRLETGDCTGSKRTGEINFSLEEEFVGSSVSFGGSTGNAISKTDSSFFSNLTFIGLITFFPNVSLAFAANPLCKRFNVFNSLIFSSSSCLGSSSAISPSSSLEDLKLTRGVIICIFLPFDIDRDFCLTSRSLFCSRFFLSSNISL